MPIPAGQNCGNCAFIDFAGPFNFYGHEVLVSGNQIGYCRVQPPFAAQHSPWPASSAATDRKTYVLGVEWPEVRADDWCGDWKAQT
jgi:hypothetical protein